MPLDPWGEPYRMISDPDTVRLQVRDPEARRLSARLLSAEETRRLEEIGQPRLSEEERRGVGALLDRLSEDDLDAREKAVAELRGWGAAILTVLDERLKLERDPEVRLRVEGIRKALPFPRSAWPREILPLAVTVGRSENLRDLEADLSTCQNHLSQLWKMEWVYASQFGGRMKRMPEATGKEFWLALAKTQPPLIDESSREIFLCVSQTADARPGTCSYRGPAVSVARLADGDAVGLCDDESHQDRAVVLRKSGEAVIVSRSDPEYERALQTTKP
jgi:hypothetical protein